MKWIESEINLYKAINLELNEVVYCMRGISNHGGNVDIYMWKLIYSIVNWKTIFMCINSQVLNA